METVPLPPPPESTPEQNPALDRLFGRVLAVLFLFLSVRGCVIQRENSERLRVVEQHQREIQAQLTEMQREQRDHWK